MNDELISRIMSREHIRDILNDIHGEPPSVAVAFEAVDEPPSRGCSGVTNRPSNLAGSTTDQISVGTLANYEAAFIDLLEEAVSSGRAVRADGLAEIESTSPVLDDPVGCVPEAVDGGIEVRALVGGEQRARLVARPVADDDNSSTRPPPPSSP
jgi:hypothetical protein